MRDQVDYPYVLMHKHSDWENKFPACGKPAYLMKEKPSYGSRSESKIVATLEGEPLSVCTEIKCGSCGKPFDLFTEDIVLRNAA